MAQSPPPPPPDPRPRVYNEGRWLVFAADDTPEEVRKRLGVVGMLIPYGADRGDRSSAMRRSTALGAGAYEFVRLGPNVPPPPQAQPPPPPPQRPPPPAQHRGGAKRTANEAGFAPPSPPPRRPPPPAQPPAPSAALPPPPAQPPPPSAALPPAVLGLGLPPMPMVPVPMPPGMAPGVGVGAGMGMGCAVPPPGFPAPPPRVREVMGERLSSSEPHTAATERPCVILPPETSAAADAQGVFSLHAYLTKGRAERLQYLGWHGVISAGEVSQRQGQPLDLKSAKYLVVNKAKLLGDAAEGLVYWCVHSDPRWSGDAHRLAPVDIWMICRTDLCSVGFSRCYGRVGNETDNSQEWEPVGKEAPAGQPQAIPPAWANTTFHEWIARAKPPYPCPPVRNTNPNAAPTTVTAQPQVFSRFGGGTIIVFGRWFTSGTRFVLDWPYGGEKGWSSVRDACGMTENTAVITAPPLIEPQTKLGEAKVFLLALDDDGRERGDATVTYAFDDAGETRLLRTGLAALLMQLDDYERAPLDGVPLLPVLRGETTSAAAAQCVDGLTEETVLGYLKARKERGLLYSLFAFVDTAERCVLHYICGLAWRDAFAFCVREGGAACLSMKDRWDFLPVHFAAARQCPAFATAVVEEMSTRHRDDAVRQTRNGSVIYDIAATQDFADHLRGLLEPRPPTREQTPEEPGDAGLRPVKKRKKKHAWDPNKDADVDISTVDTDGAIVL